MPKPSSPASKQLEAAFHRAAAPISPEALAKQFTRANPGDVKEILETLANLGRSHRKGQFYTP
jgi:hypothetical protein